MRQSCLRFASVVVSCVFAVAFASAAEEPKKVAQDAAKAAIDKAAEKVTGQTPAAGGAEQGGLPPTMVPGPHHEHLKAFVGVWDCEVKMFMPGQEEPQTSTGVFTREMAMGGRYLHGMYKSKFDGMDFEGAELMGYDVARKTYFAIWVDSMSTAMSREEGTCDADGKVFTLTGENVEGGSGDIIKTKSVTKIVDADTIQMTAYKMVDGKEVKQMELICKRKKAAA